MGACSKGAAIIILGLACVTSVWTQADLFSRANEHLRQGELTEAILGYHQILNSGKHSADLHYNLALAYYENSELSKAVLHYEKALKINPHHRLAKQNLSIIQGDVNPKVSTIPDFFLLRYWRHLCQTFSSSTWSILNIVCIILTAFGLSLFLLKKELKTKKLGFYLTIVFIFLSALLFLVSSSKLHLETDSRYAIVMKNEIFLMSGPDSRSNEKMELGAGIKVKLIDQIGNWFKVELQDKEQGWIRESEIEFI